LVASEIKILFLQWWDIFLSAFLRRGRKSKDLLLDKKYLGSIGGV